MQALFRALFDGAHFAASVDAAWTADAVAMDVAALEALCVLETDAARDATAPLRKVIALARLFKETHTRVPRDALEAWYTARRPASAWAQCVWVARAARCVAYPASGTPTPDAARACVFGACTSTLTPDADESTLRGYVNRCLSAAPAELLEDVARLLDANDAVFTREVAAWCAYHVEGETDVMDDGGRSPHAHRPCDRRTCRDVSHVENTHDREVWLGLLWWLMTRPGAEDRDPIGVLVASVARRGAADTVARLCGGTLSPR